MMRILNRLGEALAWVLGWMLALASLVLGWPLFVILWLAFCCLLGTVLLLASWWLRLHKGIHTPWLWR